MTTAEDVLAKARSSLGFQRTPVNDTEFGRWYGMNHNPWCFPAGTFVDTPLGLRRIEALRVGDWVLSASGRARRVIATGDRIAEQAVFIRAQGTDGTTATPEHPYWTMHGRDGAAAWVEAKDLQKGDYVAYPIPFEYGCVVVEEAMAYVVGRWIGDGWRISRRNGYETLICCSHEETDDLEKAMTLAGLSWNKDRQRRTAQQ